jgi:23S rRNA (uracil1939-C5)-methyltransferase
VSASQAEAIPAAARAAGDLLTLRCGRMIHGGLCLARLDEGGAVLVENALPHELVGARLRFRAKGTWFAETVEVLEPSSDRVAPPCPYVPDCGGCQLQHVAYSRQLELKREIVEDALRRRGIALPGAVRVAGMDDPWRYRIRGEFHVVPGRHGIADAGLGFNRARSWRPIAVDDCLIHDPRITESLPALRDMVHRGATQDLRTLHLTVGEDGAELLVAGKPRRALQPGALDAAAAESGGSTSSDWTTLHWRGRAFRVRPETFIQVNWSQMDVLYQRVLDALGDCAGLRIVDAYAGIGVLACLLAATAAEVVCIESNRKTAHAGLLNARVNEVAGRVRYVAQPAEAALPALAAESPVDAVLLDPPRAGCDRRVTAWLALAGPAKVVYASCDPATLARDLEVLVRSGPYRLDSLDVVDMFPQTYHVESVVALSRTLSARRADPSTW